jgi:hypothetical protein
VYACEFILIDAIVVALRNFIVVYAVNVAIGDIVGRRLGAASEVGGGQCCGLNRGNVQSKTCEAEKDNSDVHCWNLWVHRNVLYGNGEVSC